MFSKAFEVRPAVERVLGCSSVMFTESFDAGLSSLAGQLSLSLAPRRDRAATATAELRASERDRLRELLDPEYELVSAVRAELGSIRSSD
jgi:hypothetical protein